MKFLKTTFTFLVLLTLGCKSEIKQEEKQVYEDMMDIHNKVMPKMGEVNTIKRDLMTYNHSLDEKNLALKDSVLNTIMQLSASEDRMSDWMDAISDRTKKVEQSKMLQFLKNEKDSISSIENEVMLNLATAHEILNTTSKKQ